MDPVTFAAATSRIPPIDRDHVSRIAHRGLSDLAPENTLAAIDKAYEAGADGIEVDVRRTSDGEYVLMHDATVDRTTDGTGTAADMTLSAIQALDAGSWFDAHFAGQVAPTVEDALLACRGRFAYVQLELKDTLTASQAAEIVDLVEAAGMQDVVAYSSFILDNLRHVRAATRTGEVVWHPNSSDYSGIAALKPASVMEGKGTWDSARVANAHSLGLGVGAYTVTGPSEVQDMNALGITRLLQDSLMTGTPRLPATPLSFTHDWELGAWEENTSGDGAISVASGVATFTAGATGNTAYYATRFSGQPGEIVHMEFMARAVSGAGTVFLDALSTFDAGAAIESGERVTGADNYSVTIDDSEPRLVRLTMQLPPGTVAINFGVGLLDSDSGEIDVWNPKVSVEGWQGVQTYVPTLLNSWVNYGGGSDRAGVEFHPDGKAILRGVIKSGTTTANTPVFNIPDGFRPQYQQHMVTVASYAAAFLRVDLAGNVGLHSGSASWTSLGNTIYFRGASE